MLDGGQPLAILSAQALYFMRPFLNDGAEALARTLESDEEMRDFVSFLGGGADSWT